MLVDKVMTRNVRYIDPLSTLQAAAHIMATEDVGALPVVSHGKLEGIITDRDIAIRGVASENATGSLRVCDVMSTEVFYCTLGQSLKEVVSMMSQLKVRRVPVLNRNNNVVGILSLADLVKSPLAWSEVSDVLQKFKYAA